MLVKHSIKKNMDMKSVHENVPLLPNNHPPPQTHLPRCSGSPSSSSINFGEGCITFCNPFSPRGKKINSSPITICLSTSPCFSWCRPIPTGGQRLRGRREFDSSLRTRTNEGAFHCVQPTCFPWLSVKHFQTTVLVTSHPTYPRTLL